MLPFTATFVAFLILKNEAINTGIYLPTINDLMSSFQCPLTVNCALQCFITTISVAVNIQHESSKCIGLLDHCTITTICLTL